MADKPGKLQLKCGSTSTDREFRRLIKTIIEQDERHHHFPGYSITLDGDEVYFVNRPHPKNNKEQKAISHSSAAPHLDPDTFAKAKKAAPGYDAQGLLHAWVSWWRGTGCRQLKSPDATFIGFCKRKHERATLGWLESLGLGDVGPIRYRWRARLQPIRRHSLWIREAT